MGVVMVFSCKCGLTFNCYLPIGASVSLPLCVNSRWWNRKQHYWTVGANQTYGTTTTGSYSTNTLTKRIETWPH